MYLKELIERCKVQTGEKDPEEPFDVWDKKIEEAFKKLIGGRIKYGAHVIIEWEVEDPDYSDETDPPDYGYIMGLPEHEETDPEMGAIVHIPEPYADKGPGDPEWITLIDLLLLPNVKTVKIEK